MHKRGGDKPRLRDGASAGVMLEVRDHIEKHTTWTREAWNEDKVDFARKRLAAMGKTHVLDGSIWRPIQEAVTSPVLRALHITPDDILVVEGNLLLNEGLQRMIDLLIAAGGTAYNNANAYIGVGDTNTAEAASQTELLATQNAANRFYKAMVASYPQRTSQSCDWRSDFTSTEANFAWAEWTVAAGATTASGSGFLVGTTNLNRKVQSLGTKTTGTWTLTSTITFS